MVFLKNDDDTIYIVSFYSDEKLSIKSKKPAKFDEILQITDEFIIENEHIENHYFKVKLSGKFNTGFKEGEWYTVYFGLSELESLTEQDYNQLLLEHKLRLLGL